ncbi:MAG: hypothetical protein JWO48_681, partial [Bryobacterales bacterium]|nr:hypothetical protein [Bryobacterales bacterium]
MERPFWQRLPLIACFALTAVLVGQPTFGVGERVEADPMLIDKWRPATVVKLNMAGGALNGYEIRFDAEDNRQPEQYTVGTTAARGIRPMKTRENALPVQTARYKDPIAGTHGAGTPGADSPALDRAGAGGGCSSDPLLTAGQKATDSMELSFKRAILGNYQKKVSETGLSTPLGVGVSFAVFQIGQPRVNQRTLDRTDG